MLLHVCVSTVEMNGSIESFSLTLKRSIQQTHMCPARMLHLSAVDRRVVVENRQNMPLAAKRCISWCLYYSHIGA